MPLGRSMAGVLWVERDGYPVRDELRGALSDPDARRRAMQAASELLSPLEPELRRAAWWSQGWLARVIDNAPAEFDQACQRWRALYGIVSAELDAAQREARDSSARKQDRQDAEQPCCLVDIVAPRLWTTPWCGTCSSTSCRTEPTREDISYDRNRCWRYADMILHACS